MAVIVWPENGTTANTDFTIKVEIQDKKGRRVVDGIDSTLPVYLQVAWLKDLQWFNGKDPLNDILYKSMVRFFVSLLNLGLMPLSAIFLSYSVSQF